VILKRVAIVFTLVLALAVGAHADKWTFDKAHSEIGFKVKHMMISNVRGEFTDYDGFIMFDGKNWKDAKVEVNIQVNSINTDEPKRDEHLRSGDFFEIEKYPTMTFKSTKVMPPDANGNLKIMGDLTIKGVTHPVTLEAEFSGVVDDPWGNTRAGFTATTTINRQDYNVAFDSKLKDGKLVVGNEVQISLEIELVKEKM